MLGRLAPRDVLKLLLQNHYGEGERRFAQAHYMAFAGEQERKGKFYDQIGAGIKQVLKSVTFDLKRSKDLFAENQATPTILKLVYPLIVVDGKMFQYSLDDAGEPEVEEANYVKYRTSLITPVVTGPPDEEFFLIDIVTSEFLPKWQCYRRRGETLRSTVSG